MNFDLFCFPAYIDPGSGSYVLQMLAAAFFAIVFTMKMFWSKIKAFFMNRRNAGSEES
jgi:hypothetical protein